MGIFIYNQRQRFVFLQIYLQYIVIVIDYQPQEKSFQTYCKIGIIEK